MTEIQEHLLGLLKEIDGICRKYDIPYYLAGGSFVGAVRHGGFLPWDDDADIHMYRDDAERFAEAVKKEGLKNRVVFKQSPKGQYSQVHWRYENTATTSLLRSLVATDALQGQFVDIFILYPVPRDEKEKQEYVDNYELYLELRARNVSVASRNRDREYLKRYYKAKKREKIFGFRKVQEELEKKIFCYPNEDADEWLIRSLHPTHRTTPKAWWGTPRYVDFEDTQFPVAEHAEQLLCTQYGPTWFEIPAHVERGQHTIVEDFEIPYTVYTAEYGKHIDEKKFYRQCVKKKEFWFRLLWDRNVIRPQIWDMRALQLSMEIQHLVGQYHLDLKAMVEQGRFDELEAIFAPCFAFYGQEPVRFWGTYVDLPDEYLYAAVYDSCFNGNYGQAKKLLGKRKKLERPLSAELEELDAVCDATDRLLTSIYTDKDYAAAREISEEWLARYPRLVYFMRAKMALDIRDEAQDAQMLLAQCERFLESYPNDGELMKYRGDLLMKLEQKQAAEHCYERAMNKTQNGFCIREIREYFADHQRKEKR